MTLRWSFFTFKSEFFKLIEPRVRKQHLADYLKRNYLAGDALKLVEKKTDHEKMWAPLKESCGKSRFLLQNKLLSIDKIGGIAYVDNSCECDE